MCKEEEADALVLLFEKQVKEQQKRNSVLSAIQRGAIEGIRVVHRKKDGALIAVQATFPKEVKRIRITRIF